MAAKLLRARLRDGCLAVTTMPFSRESEAEGALSEGGVFLGGRVGAGARFTDHEPGIPGGETPAAMDGRFMKRISNDGVGRTEAVTNLVRSIGKGGL